MCGENVTFRQMPYYGHQFNIMCILLCVHEWSSFVASQRRQIVREIQCVQCLCAFSIDERNDDLIILFERFTWNIVSDNLCLIQLVRIKWVDCMSYSTIRIDAVEITASSRSITYAIKIHGLRWLGNVIRMPTGRLPHSIRQVIILESVLAPYRNNRGPWVLIIGDHILKIKLPISCKPYW